MSDSTSTPVTSEPEAPPKLYGLIAEYASDEVLLEAAKKVREAGYKKWDVFTPYPVHGIDDAMGIRPTILPWIVLVAGLSGLVIALGFQYWTNAVDYPFLISGKPIFSLPANIPVTFEVIILLSAFTTFFSMFILNRLVEFHHPIFSSPLFSRVTTDRFALVIEASDPRFDAAKVRALLAGTGAVAVAEVNDPKSPTAIPKPILFTVFCATLLALLPPAFVARARASKSSEPPFRYDAGMAFQPKLKPQSFSNFFEDGRSQRLPLPGVVARGESNTDTRHYLGKEGDQWIPTQPLPVTAELMQRGRERFNISCSPCHGQAGFGDGPVSRRAEEMQEGTWVLPTSLHSDYLKVMADGEIFNTITNGVRTMPAYGGRIAPDDRWAIVLYVRALQRSQGAPSSDLPDGTVPSPK